MVARPGLTITNVNSGELEPGLHRRSDVKTFYSGAVLMDGVEPIPQGGFRNGPGTRHRGWLGRQLVKIADTPLADITGLTAPTVMRTIDLGFPVPVAAIDVTDFSAVTAIDAGLMIETGPSSLGPWTQMGPTMEIATDARTRRVARVPGTPIQARYIRLSLAATTTAPNVITLGTVTTWSETLDDETVRLVAFEGSNGLPYLVSLAAGHADVWLRGAWVGCFATPYTADLLADVTVTQRLDSLLLWHPKARTRLATRANGNEEWQVVFAPWNNIPRVDYGGVYTNGDADIWSIYLTYTGTIPGQSFTINVNGEETDTIDVAGGPDWVATAAAMKTAIEALPSVEPGITITSTVKSGVTIFKVTFGGLNVGQSFSVTGAVVSTQDAAIITARQQKGKLAGEAAVSSTRGWARCGTFYQDRLVQGGLYAKGSAYIFSAVGDYYELNTDIQAASGAIVDNLDVDGNERILHLFRARHLIALTNKKLYYLSNRTVSRSDPRNWVECGAVGATSRVAPFPSSSGMVFVNAERSLVFTADYDDVSQSYQPQELSLTASHLVQAIRDGTRQQPRDDNDAERLYFVRDDGLLIIGQVIKGQDLVGFTRKSTAGEFRAVACDAENTVFVAVRRLVDGAPRIALEEIDATSLVDQAVTVTLAAPGIAVTGLEALEGATVWAIADGYAEGPYTVAGGAITLANAASSITVGRWTPPRFETLPPPQNVAERTVVARPGRIHTVRAEVIDTTSIALGANGRAATDRPVFRAGISPVDQPVQPFTGSVVATGLLGFSDKPTAVVTQVRPGALRVARLVIEAKT